MKKIITIVLVSILLLFVTGCANKDGALTHLNNQKEEKELIVPPNLQD